VQEGIVIWWARRTRGGGGAREGSATGGEHGLGEVKGAVGARRLAGRICGEAVAGWRDGRGGSGGWGSTALTGIAWGQPCCL
jgi:hypothetical protein